MKDVLKRLVIAILTWEAKLVLKKYQPKIVAITGSVGKTGTKDAVYTLLSSVTYARKSEKSFNSEFGVPLTILGLPTAWSNPIGWIENMIEGIQLLIRTRSYPEWLVLEVGADRPGDITALAWLAPHVVILTRFPDVPVHVEHFESPAQVIEEKRALKRALRPDGTLIVNHDDPIMREEMIVEGQRIIRYGFDAGATVFAEGYTIQYDEHKPVGVSCTVHFQKETAPLLLSGAIGRQHFYSMLAALSVAVNEGMRFEKAVEAMGLHSPPPGRMRLLTGVKHSTLIDDTYNSSPAAVEAGLTALTTIRVEGKKIAVLGDMMELGEFSVEEHKKVGEQVSMVAQVFVAVGVRMRAAAAAAQAHTGLCARVEMVKDSHEAAALLPTLVEPGDLVYIKGSQSTRMERVTEALLLEPSSAPKLLVRQDKEWKKR